MEAKKPTTRKGEKMDFTGSVIYEFKSLPTFWWLWLVIVAGAVCILDGKRSISQPLLASYIIFILMETVIGRKAGLIGRAELIPFWSYSHPELRIEIILNYVLFMPLGYLLYLCFGERWGLKVVLIGFLLSTSVEIVQFVFKIGLFEFDDIIGNTIGCLIGTVVG